MKKITAYLVGEIVSTNEAEAFTLYKKSNFGQPTGQKVNYSLPETLYLVEKNKIEIKKNKKSISLKSFSEYSKK